jgi:hypothetical protein
MSSGLSPEPWTQALESSSWPGATDLSLLQGAGLVSSLALPTVASDWQLAARGDWDRDGYNDSLWRNQRDGTNLWWLMDSSGNIRQTVELLQVSDVNCGVVGVGDYNGDGQLDLLWHHAQFGQTAWWIMAPYGAGMSTASISQVIYLDGVTESNGLEIGPGNANVVQAVPNASNTLTAAALQATPMVVQTESVGPGNPQDRYSFSLDRSGVFTATLTDLTADADVKLVSDQNQNGVIERGEILAWQWDRGSTSEFLRRFLPAGNYILEVSSYNQQQTNYTLSSNFAPSPTDPLQWQIQITFGPGTEGLSSATKGQIQQAAQFWQSAILQPSSLLAGQILPITVLGQDVTRSDGSPDLATLAFASPNITSDGVGITLQGGTATLNTRYLGFWNQGTADSLTNLYQTMLHEFVHVFGLGTLWEPVSMTQPDGRIAEVGYRFIDRATSSYNANTYAGWAYGELLGTYRPTAVPIEPGVFRHWDEAVFQNELMTPVAPLPGRPAGLSQLTLAALRDLGWGVNFGTV